MPVDPEWRCGCVTRPVSECAGMCLLLWVWCLSQCMPADQCPHLTATLNLHVTITALTNNNVTSQMSDFNQIILIDMVVCRVPGVDWCHAPLYTTQQYPHHQSPVTSAISNIQRFILLYCVLCPLSLVLLGYLPRYPEWLHASWAQCPHLTPTLYITLTALASSTIRRCVWCWSFVSTLSYSI